ncbi:site-2 protease, Metallo peptidase, MEROPS family M50B [Magnetococcus marinus MC-1]|uniref:Zinc metalloprotease n=1 Tax=Magnetococcus marinus (strain ATCC BAA-1437 / JCM 17883 / MC-1) TaxID=156889 RepID=A0L8R2_MAGMM|nr:RIP metalloprotease RseP [Magnetococcus marinus]ABK44355.1 site-2 protease, Metallo peptidase, MEROPS family M50B [Magnetococcus marinus MC-1]
MNEAFWAVVVLGILIFVHEMGHFLVARWMKVRVLVFSLGFGPKLLSWRGRGGAEGTEYCLSLIPLGGYVKMFGEAGVVEDEQNGERALTEEEKQGSFAHKSLQARFAVVLAGPLFNFIFAIFALWAVYAMGVEKMYADVGKVIEQGPAAMAGVQVGDRIIKVDGEAVEDWMAMRERIRASSHGVIKLEVLRGDKQLTLTLNPEMGDTVTKFGEPTKKARIGIAPSGETFAVEYGVGEAFWLGIDKTWEFSTLIFTSIKKMITQEIPADQIGGPIAIAKMAGSTAEMGFASMLMFMSLISVNLGVLNLLPIPVLDGGHLLFYVMEAIKGGPISEKAQMIAMRIGLSLLLALMVLAFYNDLVRLFGSSASN